MANLTQEQAQSLWDNRKKCVKVEMNATFQTYLFDSFLDGCKYHVNSTASELDIDGTSTPEAVEGAIVEHLKDCAYLGDCTETKV